MTPDPKATHSRLHDKHAAALGALEAARARVGELSAAIRDWCDRVGGNAGKDWANGMTDAANLVDDMLKNPTPSAPTPAVVDSKQPRAPGCKCHWEEGDSPCPVHGENEESPPVLTPEEAEEGRWLFENIPWNKCSEPAGEWKDALPEERAAWAAAEREAHREGAKAAKAEVAERVAAALSALRKVEEKNTGYGFSSALCFPLARARQELEALAAELEAENERLRMARIPGEAMYREDDEQ